MAAIVARAPLRVALGGGGTDLPTYYRDHGGFVISTAIDRYVQMLVSTGFQERYRLKHLEWEEVDEPAEIRHPILREAIVRHWHGGPLELASVSDVPPGTGLGSSGAYAVCAIAALRAAAGSPSDPSLLAEAACAIEIDALARSVGKQDQYAAAYGGVRAYTFEPGGGVQARALDLPAHVLDALREQFLLFYVGGERSASEVLAGADVGEPRVRGSLDRLQQLAREMCAALEAGDLDRCADLMSLHFEAKRDRAPGTVTPDMDAAAMRALAAGALAVTPLGAGGGGFLLAYAPDPERTRAGLRDLPELRFGLDGRGAVAKSIEMS
jgi:D-glycero-alpha-D-manno-heptose-7-phosphate kinase